MKYNYKTFWGVKGATLWGNVLIITERNVKKVGSNKIHPSGSWVGSRERFADTQRYR